MCPPDTEQADQADQTVVLRRIAVRKVLSLPMEQCIIMSPQHFEQEEFESPFAHMLALVLVLAEPGECELANTGPHALDQLRQIWCVRAAVHPAPGIHVTRHVEHIADVSNLWRSKPGSNT